MFWIEENNFPEVDDNSGRIYKNSYALHDKDVKVSDLVMPCDRLLRSLQPL